MASRYTYWTIILADGPTSFRARDRDSLVPTLRQLQSRDPQAALKWFANGRLWDSPEQAREYTRLARMTWRKTRGPEWRPGGEHRDPRDRFGKKPKREGRRRPRPAGAGTEGGSDRPGPAGPPKAPGDRPPARPARKPPFRPGGASGRDGRQRRPYRPTGGTRRGGGGGGGRGGGGRGGGGRQ